MANFDDNWGEDSQSPQTNLGENNDLNSEDSSWSDQWASFGSQNQVSQEQPTDWGNSSQDTSDWSSLGQTDSDWDNTHTQPQGDFGWQGFDNQSQQGFDGSQQWGNQEIPNVDIQGINVPVTEKTPKSFNFNPKIIGVVCFILCVILALFLFVIDGIKVKPKNVQSNTSQASSSVQYSQDQYGDQVNTTNQVSSSSRDVTMIYVPDSTPLNYSGDVYEANGSVSGKLKYVQGKQVIYCIQISLAFGSNSEIISFYCNYATFNAVGVGDLVLVKYQQPSDGYISINEVTK